MFPWIRGPDDAPPPRYNIAPTQPVAVVPNFEQPKVEFFHWGFIPYWAKDPSIGNRMINARAESVGRKPVFRNALRRRRCLVPANGFYEWKKNPDGSKTPMYIRMKGGKPFAFAGLWEKWHSPDGSEIRSCAIITGKPNELVRDIHDRMPVIVPPDQYRRWLDPREVPAEQVEEILAPYPADQMEVRVVSRTVNNARVDTPACIEPADPQEGTPVPPARLARSRKYANPEPGLFEETG